MSDELRPKDIDIWVVMNKDGPDFVAGWPELAHEHASDMAADFPELGPWRVVGCVPMIA